MITPQHWGSNTAKSETLSNIYLPPSQPIPQQGISLPPPSPLEVVLPIFFVTGLLLK